MAYKKKQIKRSVEKLPECLQIGFFMKWISLE